jgi:parvulin-like peptidyl-prolyl isomerase
MTVFALKTIAQKMRRRGNYSMFVDKDKLKQAKEERREKIRRYLKEHFGQESNRISSTVDVIDDIYLKHMNKADMQANLMSFRQILGKDQYSELKKEVDKHLMLEFEALKEKRLIKKAEKKASLTGEGASP